MRSSYTKVLSTISSPPQTPHKKAWIGTTSLHTLHYLSTKRSFGKPYWNFDLSLGGYWVANLRSTLMLSSIMIASGTRMLREDSTSLNLVREVSQRNCMVTVC